MLTADNNHDAELKLEYQTITCLTDEDHLVEVAMASAPTADVTDNDPRSLQEAMGCSDWPEWKEAMDDELALMAKYNIWDEVDQPEDMNIVGCRWVFRIKCDSSGKILKYCAVPCRFWVWSDRPNLAYDGNPRNRSRPSARSIRTL